MRAPDPAAEKELLVDAAEAAGQVALSFFRKDPKVWTKSDDSPVSEADLAVNAALQTALTGARPKYGWLSEESEDDPARLSAARTFIVDPIDGTRAFVAGRSAWALAVALVEDGCVIAATVHMPEQGKTYAASLGDGSTLNGTPIRCAERATLTGANFLTNKTSLRPENWGGHTLPVTPHFRPSLAYRICLVAEGRYDACLTLRDAWEWDTAAACLVATEAGAVAADVMGTPIRFNAPTPQHNGLVVAGGRLHSTLMDLRAGKGMPPFRSVGR